MGKYTLNICQIIKLKKRIKIMHNKSNQRGNDLCKETLLFKDQTFLY